MSDAESIGRMLRLPLADASASETRERATKLLRAGQLGNLRRLARVFPAWHFRSIYGVRVCQARAAGIAVEHSEAALAALMNRGDAPTEAWFLAADGERAILFAAPGGGLIGGIFSPARTPQPESPQPSTPQPGARQEKLGRGGDDEIDR